MKNIVRIPIIPGRIFGLDLLRALAILFVLLEHGSNLMPENIKIYNNIFVWDGVSIFFVLSGFLIGGILIKLINNFKVDVNLLIQFWIRRWFRTIPNYLLILLLLIFINYIFQNGFPVKKTFSFFIFFQNFSNPHPQFFQEAWSLSVEEWFYLITPISIFISIYFFRMNVKKAVLISALGILIFVFLFRVVRYMEFDSLTLNDWDLSFRKQVITRLDSLMFGVIGAFLQFYYASFWTRFKNQFLILGITLLFIGKFFIAPFSESNSYFYAIFSFPYFSLSTLFLIPFLSRYKIENGYFYRFITKISLISYSLYLLNLSVVQRTIIRKIPWEYWQLGELKLLLIQTILFWTLTVFFSILLYKYFELPMMKLRDKNWMKKYWTP